MGSAASSKSNEEPLPENPLDERKQMLLQRKVTVDILENLARKLPLIRNPLGDDLKLVLIVTNNFLFCICLLNDVLILYGFYRLASCTSDMHVVRACPLAC